MLWDVFCRVVDNFGDIGVCWRAAADLAQRGERVRLWVDDARALAWMAPQGQPGVQVLRWSDAEATSPPPGDVVVEAFGCDPPPAFVARMAAAARAPVWINLEYLSAEPYVERSHALPSPQSTGPGAGLVKWFFYPGFTPRTGGLLREPGLVPRLDGADGDAWLAAHDWGRRPGERVVSFFGYPNPALPALLDALAAEPTLLLATAGCASAVQSARDRRDECDRLRTLALPWLTQPDYDRLLAACDLNFVRGEDSFVRAQWAARPFVWHLYPQADGAHAVKLAAFQDLFLAGADPAWGGEVRRFSAAWNGLAARLAPLPPLAPWREHARRWRDALLGQRDLALNLLGFVAERR
jgi:uncharacterized repeat protein (TIGR03837 family)